ncbi:MAG: energy-coupling factor ABC transporter ATP-binding protein [Euryarchaeota archaeon]|nr:energy-coupling factor ABC transporter ATP-binding protein [Euryarchaeota archaeon]
MAAERALLSVRDLSGPRVDPDRLRDVSFDLPQGGLLHVHGPSGSGKTTLLRLLARLAPSASGEVWLDGAPMASFPAPEWRRRVALVFQEPSVLEATVRDELESPARLHGRTVDVEALLGSVGLDVGPERDPSRLSGGERKRLTIARSLAVDPDVVMLDEPTSSIDPERREEVHALVRRLVADGLGVLVVSHLVEDLEALPGPVLLLGAGRAVRSTTTEAFLAEAAP